MLAEKFALKSRMVSRMAKGFMPSHTSAVRVRSVDLDLQPIEVAARCRHLEGMVFFDSARETGDWSQISVIAAEPSRILRGRIDTDFERLRAAVTERRIETVDRGIPAGFAAGWVEYDGEYCFGIYDHALIYRHAEDAWFEVGDFAERLASEEAKLASVTPVQFHSAMSREHYCQIVRRAQEYIAAGDIYQVNLAHRFAARWDEVDEFSFYEKLRESSPAPYGAYLAMGGRSVLSTSPECFLTLSGDAICTRPIKGTRPRCADANADEKSAYDLITSPKEIAELVMITDLERNDLGQVCDYGSVRVKELLKLERFEQVFHLVSTVEGRLRAGIDHVTALRACFPGGSITGAPKKRAREIIAELEPMQRGLYTGTLGWFGFNGESRFNIAIRTLVVENGMAHFHVGAGIVADSIAEMEWQETLDKAAGILSAARG
jgi:para-aminobenzoate synthetase component I